MKRLAFRNLLSRPLRTALTTLAILLGVAMISGTYVLTDQITNAFDGIFATAYKGTATVVTPKSAVGSLDGESAGKGVGASKKEAEQQAARVALARVGVSFDDVDME